MSAFTLDKRPDGVAVLTLDLPGEKVNKLTTRVMEELSGILDTIAADREIKALVITSAKRGTFIAGADIAEIRDITDAARGEELSRRGQAMLQKIENLPIPTVAAIQGACLGGGFELALACSHRVVSDDPRTSLGLPEVKIGIIPGFGGTQRLPRLAGLTNALAMITTGGSVPAKKARRLGLADQVVHNEHLLDAAIGLALHAAGRPRPTGIRAGRTILIRLLESNPLTRSLILRSARKRIFAETRGNYPAPVEALEPVRTGLSENLAAGYASEARTIGRLIVSEESKNLITVFYLNEMLKKEGGPSPSTARHAAVIGAGLMGGGISQLLAEKGIPVRMQDVTAQALAAGFRAADAIFRKRVNKGIIEPLLARDGMDRISGTTDLSGLARADIVVEAVVENLAVKKSVLRKFESLGRQDAIFATNTSSLSITELQSASARPGRVVGMHFFNPVEKMPLVEIVRGSKTTPEAVAAITALARRLGKLPVLVNDGPGFLVNRILMPYLGEALRMVEEGASVEPVDRALLNFGMPMGAFLLLDEIGIDVAHKVSLVLHQGLGDRIRPSGLLEKFSQEGRLGKKNGKGFYLYRDGKRGSADPAVAAMVTRGARPAGSLTDQMIVERCVLLMIKEAALCLEEGIIDRPDLLDAALIFGIGFPPFRGGLLRYADRLGASAVVVKMEAYARSHGDRFLPSASLRTRAEQGRGFYP